MSDHPDEVTWDELLRCPRTVLLAEASSGKTTELRQACARLRHQSRHAYFLTVEDLADGSLRTALTSMEESSFEAWLAGTDRAWFFLDSIDEARLSRKRFDAALRQLARDLGTGLVRSAVMVSCRLWRGSADAEALDHILPVHGAVRRTIEELASSALRVVHLNSLTRWQRKSLAEA